MKKIYEDFCIFFAGSLLPIMTIELYFHDYFIVELTAIFAGVLYTVCFLIEYLKEKAMRWSDLRQRKMENVRWVQQTETAGRASVFYFRNYY